MLGDTDDLENNYSINPAFIPSSQHQRFGRGKRAWWKIWIGAWCILFGTCVIIASVPKFGGCDRDHSACNIVYWIGFVGLIVSGLAVALPFVVGSIITVADLWLGGRGENTLAYANWFPL